MVKRSKKSIMMQTWFITYMTHSDGLLHTEQITTENGTSLFMFIANMADVRCIVCMHQWFPPVMPLPPVIKVNEAKKVS